MMGLFFAFLGIAASRIALLVLWFFTPLGDRAFEGWLWPLLGLIFLPFTTLMYALVVVPLGSTNPWAWLILGLAFFVDIAGWMQANAAREDKLRALPPFDRNPT